MCLKSIAGGGSYTHNRGGEEKWLIVIEGGGGVIANFGEFKVKTVGSPPTLAQRVLNETLWNPAFFCCWKIEASQG
jgi:hypothetical protein